MGIPSRRRIDSSVLGFQCQKCMSDLAQANDAIRGEFRGHLGPAVFVKGVINVDYEPRKTKYMTSGKYVVRYVNCRFCQSYLGWVYVRSFDKHFCYKEGKFCLEAKQILSLTPEIGADLY